MRVGEGLSLGGCNNWDRVFWSKQMEGRNIGQEAEGGNGIESRLRQIRDGN